jgi:hypothetical protein
LSIDTEIVVTTIHHGRRAPAAPLTVHGAALGPTGGAIVTVRHVADERPHVAGVRTFRPALKAMGAAIEALLADDPACRVIVDGGLHGLDLWQHLGGRRRHGLDLFETPRPELRRFEIAGKLRSLYESKGFSVARSLGTDGTLRKAISDATREDAADRPEIVALSLALVDRRRLPRIF